MRNNLSLKSNTVSISRGSSQESTYGRVLDVILDESHPEYENQGGSRALYGVFIEPAYTGKSTSTPDTFSNFIYNGMTGVKMIPTPGEIVVIESLPSPELQPKTNPTQQYYTSIVNVWNHPNSNPYLNIHSNSDLDITKDGTFKVDLEISPIRVNLGDVAIFGRQGQSLRFSGAGGATLGNSNTGDIGNPIVVLSDFTPKETESYKPTSENINTSNSILTLSSGHLLDLNPAENKQDSYKTKPQALNSYKDSQINLNSGRIVVNAHTDSVLVHSKDATGISSKSVNIDSTEYICIDSPEIYLGADVKSAIGPSKEPVILGNQLEQWLSDLVQQLDLLAADLTGAVTAIGIPVPLLNKSGATLTATLKVLKSQLNPSGKSKLKSKKVFTD